MLEEGVIENVEACGCMATGPRRALGVTHIQAAECVLPGHTTQPAAAGLVAAGRPTNDSLFTASRGRRQWWQHASRGHAS